MLKSQLTSHATTNLTKTRGATSTVKHFLKTENVFKWVKLRVGETKTKDDFSKNVRVTYQHTTMAHR